MDDSINQILRRVDQSEQSLVGLTRRLIRIPSVNPPGNEGPVAELAAEELRKLGFVTQIIEADRGRGNVIAHLKGRRRSPSLCAFAHTDVVPPGDLKAWKKDPFSGAIANGRIYGRGASDHKFPISALIFAVRSIIDTIGSFEGDLVLLFTADEEAGSEKGLRFVLEKNLVHAKAGLYAGPSSFTRPTRNLPLQNENVIIASSGFALYRLLVRGSASHMMNLEAGVNAIEKATQVISGLHKLIRRVNQQKDPMTGRSRMSVTMINGGVGEAMVPDSCQVLVSRFISPSETFQSARKELACELGLLRQKDPALSVKLTEMTKTPIAMTPKQSTLVTVIQKAGLVVRGRKPATVGIPTFTDMGWFQKFLGVPTALFGYGDLALAHRPNENIRIRDLVDSAKAYAYILLQMLNSAQR